MVPATDADLAEVVIVIVTWNSGRTIGNCLDSLGRSTCSARPWRVVVIDNASSDDTVAEVRRREKDLPLAVVVNETNRGLAAANNQGIALSRGDVVISNPDVDFGPGALDALVGCLMRHPRAGFVVAHLLHEDGATQTSVGNLPRLSESLLGRRIGLRRNAAADRGVWWDGWHHAEEREVGHGQEACYLVRRAAIDEIGPQDERFWLDWEGYEWTARMRAHAWEVWFCPDAAVVHVGGVSITQATRRWIVSSHRGMYLYHSRDVQRLARPLLALVIALRCLSKFVASLMSRGLYAASHR